jgi:hypothetical protein
VANLGPAATPHPGPEPGWGLRLFTLRLPDEAWSALGPWSVALYLAGARR